MGVVFSCFPCFPSRRYARDEEDDNEPLLDEDRHPTTSDEQIIPSQETFNKVAEIVAALSTGKLPTQGQLNDAIRVILSSNLLNDAQQQLESVNGHVGSPTAKLSHWGLIVLDDVYQVLQALIELGTEKNRKWILETGARTRINNDLFYQSRQVSGQPVHVDTSYAGKVKENLKDAGSKATNGETTTVKEVQSDTNTVLSSLKDVIALLFTSTSFRVLLTDVLFTTRELLADTLANVAESGEVITSGAQTAENIIRPSQEEKENLESPADAVTRPAQELGDAVRQQQETIKSTEDTLRHSAEESVRKSKEVWSKLQEESPDRIKETIVHRLRMVVQQISQQPQYRSSIGTMMVILQKYGERGFKNAAAVLDAAEAGTSSAADVIKGSSPSEVVDVDPHLSEALNDISTLVERFAAGRKLEPVVQTTSKAIKDLEEIVEKPEGRETAVKNVLASVREYCDHAASDPDWLNSEEAKTQLNTLYDSVHNILSGKTPAEKQFKTDLAYALEQIEFILEGFSKDRATNRLVSSLNNLYTHMAHLTSVLRYDYIPDAAHQSKQAAQQIKREIRNDILSFVIPRLLRAVRVIPLPRVEYKSADMDIVLDNLNLESLSFIPDRIVIHNLNEMQVLGSDATRLSSSMPSITSTATRTKVKIEGLRVSTKDVAYFVDYHAPGWSRWGVGWNDLGRLTIDVGGWRSAGEGLMIEVEVELDAVDTTHTATREFSRRLRSDSAVTGSTLLNPPSTVTRMKVLDVKVDAPGLHISIDKSKHWIFNSLCLQPLLAPTIREALQLVVAQKVKTVLEGLSDRVESASSASQGNDGADFTSPEFWKALIFGAPQPERSRSPSPPLTPSKTTSTSVTFKGVVQKSTVKATGEESMLTVGIGEQILPEVRLPSPTTEHPHARNVDEAGDILVEGSRGALDELQAGAEGVAKGVREDVEDVINTAGEATERVQEELGVAQKRMEDVRQREKDRKGWKSDVFNLH